MVDLFKDLGYKVDEAEVARLDLMLNEHYTGKGQWLNSLDVDLAWARISFLESAK